ncbi:MAG: hypothetical protein AAGC55_18970, partial [Myxococcota bacterium]
RFENAEQFRLAVQGYLHNRGSERLAAVAEAALSELHANLARVQPGDAEQRQQLYKLFGACRFGFREALAAWHSNEQARAGLERATVAMIEYELAQGDQRAAAALAADLPDTPDHVLALLDRARRDADASEQRAARLKQLGRRLDINDGRQSRTAAILILGLSFTLIPSLVMWRFGDLVFRSHGHILAWNALFLVLCGAVGYRYRASLRDSQINRRLFTLLLSLLIGQIPLQLGLWAAGFSPAHSLLVHVFIWFFLALLVAVTFDRRLLPAALGYLLTFLAMSVDPDLGFYITAAPHGLLTVNAVLIWRPSRAKIAAPGSADA